MSDALSQVSDMSTNIAATDWSKQILDSFFGDGWNTFLSGSSTTTEATSLIFEILGSLNTIAMFCATVLLTVFTLYGVIGTAHEGNFLGKRMHSVWAPVRSTVAISFLAPVAKGLCVLQIIILASVGMSINFANTLWGTGLDFMKENQGKISTILPADTLSNFDKVVDYTIYATAVQRYMQYYQNKEFSGNLYEVSWEPDYYVAVDPYLTGLDQASVSGRWLLSFNIPWSVAGSGDGSWSKLKTQMANKVRDFTSWGVDSGDLWSISIPATSQSDAIGLARRDAVVRAVTDVGNIVGNVVAAKKGANTPSYDRNDIIAIVENYDNTVKPILKQAETISDVIFQEGLNDFVDDAKNSGWLFAGSYYWTISRYAERQSEVVNNKPTFKRPDKDEIQEEFSSSAVTSHGSQFRGIIKAVIGKLSSKSVSIEDKAKIAKSGLKTDPMEAAKNMLALNWSDNVINYFVGKMSSEGDIIGNMSTVGHYCINTALGMIAFQTIVAIAGDVASNPVAEITSLGLSSIISGGAKVLGSYLMSAIMPIMLLGFFLAFYLPALPWIAWTLATVGWVLLCLESLFAAPLWAVAHSIPEGEGIAGTHGKQGYMLFLAVLLRPPLMVAGFFCAVILAGILGKFIGGSFAIFQAGMNAEHSGPISGPVSVIPMLFIFGSTCIVATHKIFKLITHLPDTVTKWIGQQVQNLGEDQDESRLRGATTTAINSGATALSTGMGAAIKQQEALKAEKAKMAEAQGNLGTSDGEEQHQMTEREGDGGSAGEDSQDTGGQAHGGIEKKDL
nr:DotA/TraY family protein [uncultured Desulfobacter sp.]